MAERKSLTPENGWSKLSALPTDVSQYFFAIYDNSTEKALVLDAGVNQGSGNKTMWYRTDVNPETNRNAVWMIDAFKNNYSGATSDNFEWLVFTGAGDPDNCLHSNDKREWNYRAENNGEGWTDRAYVSPTYLPEGYWTLTNRIGGEYIGHWNETDEIAGNASGDRVGHFDLYAITRGQYVAVAEDIYSATSVNPIDISYVITNSDATRKNNFHENQPVGWTLSSDAAVAVEYGSWLSTRVGESYFNIWQDSGNLSDREMRQTVTGLPSGRYRLSVVSSSSTIASGAYLFANDDKADMTQLTDNKASITFDITDGELTFGVKLEGYQSNDCKFDHFTLEYLGWSFPVAFGTSGFGTFACPQKLALPDDESVKAYTATVSGMSVTFHKLTGCIPANTGVLVSGTANSTANLYVTDEDAEETENEFVAGTGATFTGDDNTYYFAVSKNAAELTFGTFNPSSVAIATNKAYLPIDKGAFTPGARLSLSFEDEETAISFIEAEDTEAPVKKDGKYLEDGKIVIVKNGVKYSANGQKLN